jgi:hypothetical protein
VINFPLTFVLGDNPADSDPEDYPEESEEEEDTPAQPADGTEDTPATPESPIPSQDPKLFAGFHLRQTRLKNLLKSDVSRRSLSINTKMSYYTEYWSFGEYCKDRERFSSDVSASTFVAFNIFHATGDKSGCPKFLTVGCSSTSKYQQPYQLLFVC